MVHSSKEASYGSSEPAAIRVQTTVVPYTNPQQHPCSGGNKFVVLRFYAAQITMCGSACAFTLILASSGKQCWAVLLYLAGLHPHLHTPATAVCYSPSAGLL
jgi:hypothetical protein